MHTLSCTAVCRYRAVPMSQDRVHAQAHTVDLPDPELCQRYKAGDMHTVSCTAVCYYQALSKPQGREHTQAHPVELLDPELCQRHTAGHMQTLPCTAVCCPRAFPSHKAGYMHRLTLLTCLTQSAFRGLHASSSSLSSATDSSASSPLSTSGLACSSKCRRAAKDSCLGTEGACFGATPGPPHMLASQPCVHCSTPHGQ